MIAKLHRFHGLTSLRLVYGRGQTVRGSALAVKYIQNSRRDTYRAAVVVSRKTHKSAVVRNRIRRRIYEIIRGMEPEIVKPYDIVVTVYSDQVADLPAADLRTVMADLLQKAGIASGLPPAALGRDSGQLSGIVVPKERH